MYVFQWDRKFRDHDNGNVIQNTRGQSKIPNPGFNPGMGHTKKGCQQNQTM